MADERIRVTVEATASDLRRALREGRGDVKAFTRDVEGQNARLAASNTRAAHSFQGVRRELQGGSRDADHFSLALGRASKGLVGLVKPAAGLVAVGAAAGGLNAAAAGAVALTGALAPLSGALVAVPGLFAAGGQAAGVFKLATTDLTAALKGNEKAYQRLTPRAREFADELKRLKPQLQELRTAAQDGLFTGASKGLKAAERNFGVLKGIVRETSGALGDLAKRAGELAGGKAFGKDLQRVGATNTRVIRDLGTGALSLADALRHVLVAGGPLIRWMSESAREAAKSVDVWARHARASGELARFFSLTREAMSRVASISGHVARGLVEIGKAATPLGRDLLAHIDAAAGRMEAWTRSLEGRNQLRDYFAQARAPLMEAGRLAADIFKTILRVGNQPVFTQMLHQIRVDLLPLLEQVVSSTTSAFGPTLISALTNVIKLVGQLAGSSGPLIQLVRIIGGVAGGMADLLDAFPPLKSALVSLLALGGIYRALQIGATISGLRSIVGLVQKASAVQAGGGIGAIGTRGARAAATSRVGGLNVVGPATTAGGAGAVAGAGPAAGAVAGALIVTQALQNISNAGFAQAQTKGEKFATFVQGASKSLSQFGRLIPLIGKPLADFGHDLEHSAHGFTDWSVKLHSSGLEWEAFKSKLRIDRETGQVEAHIRQMQHRLGGYLSEILSDSRSTFRLIAQTLGNNTAAGKDAVDRNFRATVAAIRSAMHDGTVSADRGAKAIRDITASYLKRFGLNPTQIANRLAGNTDAGRSTRTLTPGRKGGRFFGQGGMVSALLSPGEALAYPDGSWGMVPGRPVAADTVPMALPAGTGVLTYGGQAMMAMGASLDQAISAQPPHFQHGGVVRMAAGGTVPRQKAASVGDFTPGIQKGLDVERSVAQAILDKARTDGAGAAGTGSWHGVQVAGWIIQLLKYAAQHGFHGQVTSGYRSHATNVAHGRFYTSQHEFTRYPGGAIDFGGPHDAHGAALRAQFLAAIQGNPWHYRMYPLLGDDGHVSGTGHRAGGWVRRMAGGGWVRTGATVDRGGDPKQTAHGGMSYAELEATPGFANYSGGGIRRLLGKGHGGTGLPIGYPLWARNVGGGRAYKIFKSDNGDGAGNAPHSTVDLHGQIADILHVSKKDIEIADGRKPAPSSTAAPAGAAGSRQVTRYRTVVPRAASASRAELMSGAWRRDAFDAGWGRERGAGRGLFFLPGGAQSALLTELLGGMAADTGLFTRRESYTAKAPGRGTRPASTGRGPAAALSWAERWVGQGDTPKLRAAVKAYGWAPGEWCGLFAAGAARAGGASPDSSWASTENIWAAAASGGHGLLKGRLPISAAKPGDLALFDWNANGSPNHVGMIRKVLGRRSIATVEGNTGGGRVENRTRSGSVIMGAARPAYRTGGIVQAFAKGGTARKAPGSAGGLGAAMRASRVRARDWRRSMAANRKASRFRAGFGRLRDYIDLTFNTPMAAGTFAQGTGASFGRALLHADSDGSLLGASAYLDARLRETLRHRDKRGQLTGVWKTRQDRMKTMQEMVLTAAQERLHKPIGVAQAALDELDPARSRAEQDWQIAGIFDTLDNGDPNPEWATREAVMRQGWIQRLQGTLPALQDMRPRVARWGPAGFTARQDIRDEITAVQDRIRALSAEAALAGRPATGGGEGDGSGELAGITSQLLAAQLESNRIAGRQHDILAGFAPLAGQRLVGAFAHGGLVGETGMALVHRGEWISPDPAGPYSIPGAGQARQGPAEVTVQLTLEGDASHLVRLVDARVDDRAARVVSEQMGRRARNLIR